MAQRPTAQHPASMPRGADLSHMTPGGAFPGTPAGAGQMLGGLQSEVSPEAAPLWEFALRHARVIAFGVVGLVLIIVAVAAWQWYAESAHEDSRRELALILSTRDNAKKLNGLKAFLPNAPDAMKSAVLLESASAAMALNNLAEAEQALAQVQAQEKTSPLGFATAMNRADVLMRMGKSKEAVELLDSLLVSAPDALRPVLNQQIADFATSAGMKQRALTAYDALLAGLPPTDTQNRAFYTRLKNQLQ